MSRDDISKTSATSTLGKVALLPGQLIQWLIYMFPTAFGAKHYAQIRMLTRWARSPIMCKFFAFVFWLGLVAFSIMILLSPN